MTLCQAFPLFLFFFFIHDGFAIMCGAFKRLDVVSDLLRVGLGTDRSDRIYGCSEMNRGVAECVHGRWRNRSVLVFIKARESAHSSAPGLACVA